MKKLFVVTALTLASALDVTFAGRRTVEPAAQIQFVPSNREQRRAFARMKR